MRTGIDANVNCSKHAKCIKEAGFEFVGRYYKFTSGSHPLTHAEAIALSKEGLSIVAVYESGRPTKPSYFFAGKGFQDGTRAYEYARDAIHQPAGAPIYFAVDYDASAKDIEGPVTSYFEAIAKAFEDAGKGDPLYPVGVYGSGATCAWLLNNTAVTYAWLSESRGWAGTRTFTGWNIRQHSAPGPVCGVSVDLNESHGHGGGFKVG